ncbi:MAG: hypothetical protein RR920_04260 [Lachnospiraceae bacterium]
MSGLVVGKFHQRGFYSDELQNQIRVKSQEVYEKIGENVATNIMNEYCSK